MSARRLFIALSSMALLVSAACSDDATPATMDTGSSIDTRYTPDGGVGKTDGSQPGSDGKVVENDGPRPTGDGQPPRTDGSQPKADQGTPKTDQGSQCTNQCTKGAKQCSASTNGWQACDIGSEGCTAWGQITECQAGEVCSGGQCMRNCINQCTKGARICSGAGYIVCEVSPSGCTDWTTVTPCETNKVCSGGQCVQTCTNQCTTGTKQCSGTGVQSCELDTTSNCTEWGNPIPCDQGQICSGGKCVGNCINQCTASTTRCSGTNLQTCKLMASGCTDWDTPQPCATGTCHNAICDTGVCQKGDKRCNGLTVEECDSGGFWVVVQTCPQACDGGGCTNTVVCSSSTRRCNNEVIEECNATGTAWLYLESCQHSCNNGLCEGGCESGAKRCNGEKIETCKTDGSGWDETDDCSATFCYSGKCAEKELKLDGQTITLEGEHVYAGDVILKGSTSIAVGPSGWLRIRAKNISIDATSSIIAPAVGDDPAGRGRSVSCSNQYYCGSTTKYGATGGGYGSSGGSLNRSVTVCSYRTCSLRGSGGAANGQSLAAIHLGSRGGRCNTANGGGMIDLRATQRLEVAGNLRADGGNGTGNCAGGSGGGIRLVAEDVAVSGIISAKGGTGSSNYTAGGNGRIKILYGSKQDINATLNGTVEQTVMPPMDLRSSTHPDPNRIYNDGFTAFNVSWTRPYSNALNYRYNFNQTPVSVPNFQSDKTDVETVTIDADQLKTGHNFFHAVSVQAGATIGVVEGNLLVRINGTVPTVTSQSHTSQGSWYDLADVQLQWTNPHADENYRAYYYVFDRYADTIPTKGDSKLPIYDKDLLIPNRPAGTIWYFHIIAEDTMGYLTKNAQHFRVQIGPSPDLGSLNGDIWEDGSTPKKPLDGVKVTLNRGYASTITANGGQYFFNNTLPSIANKYELRAEKDGYQTFVKEVEITAGATTRVDIALKKKL